ncbi:tRNA (cytidine(34)-2'-O)-methyltransferase [bacterium]|nr:tRNA (cytidine(34)-2'-O)-methyltransferase [bacterium]
MGRKSNTFIDEEGRQPKDRKLTREGALTIVLLHPRIPQNTGSIARLCAATGSRLDLVRPLFEIDDTKLKRAGLDYWHLLDVRHFESWDAWQLANPDARPWFVEVGGSKLHSEANYQSGEFIVFGDEQDGILPSLLEKYSDRTLRLPQQGVRSINLSNAVSVVTYEALRQLNWLGLED